MKDPRRRVGRVRGCRAVLVAVLAALTMVSSEVLIAPPVSAQTDEAKSEPARDLPALDSDPAPAVELDIPVGDFASPPPFDGSAEDESATPKESAFDPARSTVIETETTATKLVYENSDGSRTALVDSRPARFQDDSDGAWKDIDLSLVDGGGGTLQAKSGPAAASVGGRADGDVVSIDTEAGAIALSHPDATAAAVAAIGNKATYPQALPGGRDVVVTVNTEGFEESVILPDATAPASYIAQFNVPEGVSARDLDSGGIEFVDGSGAALATFGSALAYDASFPKAGPGATAPVTVRLVPIPVTPAATTDEAVPTPSTTAPATTPPSTETTETTEAMASTAAAPTPDAATEAELISVEVGLDPAWLSARERVFPVTVDPALTVVKLTSAAGNRDTWVYSGVEYATTSYAGHPWLLVGSGDGGAHVTRSMLYFDMGSLPSADVVVGDAHLALHEWYSFAGSCAPRAVNVQGLGAAFSDTTTWNTQPGLDTAGVVSAPSFARHTATGSACTGSSVNLDTTSLVSRWLKDGAPNYGVSLRAADETDPYSYKGFYSEEGSITPQLVITYTHRPAPATQAAPANGSRISTPVTRVEANATTDPDGDPLRYWFRGSPRSDVSGHQAIDSGWLDQTFFDVPPGLLADGETYWWHVFSWDGVFGGTGGSYGYPTQQWTFSADRHLGVDGAEPYDSMGAVSVNLAGGNLLTGAGSPTMASAGGPVGLSYAYNSQAPSATAGLTGTYYNDLNDNRLFDDTPVLIRRDRNIDSFWGSGGPGAQWGRTSSSCAGKGA